ncbi:NACHT domain-containing protein [Streptomyces sp. JV185]|uniref:NACHT domain-containing protein n=1 Tax=Streptomyces sp. JV185 TaxID=858638 RepID=UPI002E7A45BA|nr:NACHT domain-containing protein [Streptomyces sp. JV185]MEE1769284.1 NACHT domain-containing protein [Streptomyces sp. JV185]
MPAGRPRTRKQPIPELKDLAAWFVEELARAGHPSVNAFLTRLRNHHGPGPRPGPLPDKNTAYDIFKGFALHDADTTRSLAQALGSSPEAITSLWLTARRALDRKELAQRRRPAAGAPTWETLPQPSVLLEDLLRSQASAAEQFPYDLLGVRKPPLSEIYVEQDFQPFSPAEASPAAARPRHEPAPPSFPAPRSHDHADPTPTLTAVLAGHDHLFITGGPGAGKTTLGRHLVRQIARYWLREEDAETPWCPAAVAAIRVTAADLLTPYPWSRQLSDAVGRAGTLLSHVDHSHFEVPPHGTRWLVVVDGLDEVSSPTVRERLLEKLAEQVRSHGPCRLLITSRPLPQEELKPFSGLPGVGFYTLRGFDGEQQHAFAARWFAAQGDPDASAHAEEFLADVADAALEEVLQVPLLATIAAAFRTRNPDRPLPRGRVELYEMFLADLKNAREGNAEVLSRFLERWTVRGYGKVAAWLVRHQGRLLTHLARERTTGKPPSSLLDAALEWLARHLPADLEWPEGARGELGQFLAQSGVVAFDGRGLSFLHQSFAEFIAARDEAASIPSDFPDFDQWSGRIADAANGNRVLFTLALWARRPGNDVAVVVRRLLAGRTDHRIMALRLVTSGVPLGESLETAVIERLLDFSHDFDHERFAHSAHSVLTELAGLSQLRGHRRLAERLRTIATTEGISLSLRAKAAWAYARVAHLPEGVRLLKPLTQSAGDSDGTLECCRHLEALAPQEAPYVVARLSALVTAPNASLWARLRAASILLRHGSTEGLTDLARSILSGPPVDGRILWNAGELWYDVAGPAAAHEVAATITKRGTANSWETGGLAMVLFRFGLLDQAIPMARRTFEESISDEEVSDLVELWLELRGSRGADEMVAMAPGLRNWNTDDHRDAMAFTLELQGFEHQAAAIVRTVLEEAVTLEDRSMYRIFRRLRSNEAEFVAEVWSRLERLGPGPDDCATYLEHLQKRKAPAESILPLARTILNHPGADNKTFTQAASALLTHGGADACEEVLAALRDRPYDGAALRRWLLPVLAEHDEAAAVADLGTRMLADPGVTGAEMAAVVRAWLRIAGRAGVHEVVKRIEAACLLTTDQSGDLAALLLELGHADAAVPLWCRVCATPGTGVETRWHALQQLIAAGAEAPAEHALRTALAASRQDPAETLALRRHLAWLTATP